MATRTAQFSSKARPQGDHCQVQQLKPSSVPTKDEHNKEGGRGALSPRARKSKKLQGQIINSLRFDQACFGSAGVLKVFPSLNKWI